MRSGDAGPDASRGPAGSTGSATILPFRRRSRYCGIGGDFFKWSFEAQLSRIAELNAAGVPWPLIFRLINDREQRE
jgi:hypothetical protein